MEWQEHKGTSPEGDEWITMWYVNQDGEICGEVSTLVGGTIPQEWRATIWLENPLDRFYTNSESARKWVEEIFQANFTQERRINRLGGVLQVNFD